MSKENFKIEAFLRGISSSLFIKIQTDFVSLATNCKQNPTSFRKQFDHLCFVTNLRILKTGNRISFKVLRFQQNLDFVVYSILCGIPSFPSATFHWELRVTLHHKHKHRDTISYKYKFIQIQFHTNTISYKYNFIQIQFHTNTFSVIFLSPIFFDNDNDDNDDDNKHDDDNYDDDDRC